MTAQLSAQPRKCSCGGTCGKCAPKSVPQPQQTTAVEPHAPQRFARDFSRVPVHAANAREEGSAR